MFLINRSVGRLFNLGVSLAIFLAAIPCQSQDKKDPHQPLDEQDVIKVNSNLVTVDVVVKDKKGKFVTDLSADDFTVSENGVPQRIEFFDSTLTGKNGVGRSSTTIGSTGPRSEPPSDLPRNIIALVLDGQSTQLANLKHVREGVERYIQERISDSDSVALFSISGGLQLLQSFTHDKARLIAAVDKAYTSSSFAKTSEARGIAQNIESLRNKIAGGPDPSIPLTGPSAAAAGSAAAEVLIAQHVLEEYMQLRTALSVQQTRPVLAGLAAICEGLRPVPGKKTLVMFSEGFVTPEMLDWQLQSTIDIANRANVAIYVIDASGLTGGAPTSGGFSVSSPLGGISGDNSMESRRRVGGGESVFDITRQEGLNRQQDVLYKIAEDTGGHFIKNTNDIAVALDRIDSEIRSRYTLAYRSSDSNFDSSFRKVKIEVRRPDTTVVARSGYYAIPPSQIVPFSPEDQKLLANFSSMEAHSTLPLAMELTAFRSLEDFYVVPLSFEIPPAAVQFDRKGDKRRLQLEVLAVVRNEGEDKILSRLGGNFDVALSPEQYESIMNDKISYRQDMQLEAGNYTVDLIVRDRVSGKVAAKREKLVLPVASADFWVTDAVLSRHAEPLKTTPGGEVFSDSNIQVRPSPSREFHTTDNLIIFFKLYNAAISREIGQPLVRVTVTLTKNGQPVMRPIDYQLTEPTTEPVSHLTFAKYIKLAGLAPGNYYAVIESRDIVQQKVSRQEAAFSILP